MPDVERETFTADLKLAVERIEDILGAMTAHERETFDDDVRVQMLALDQA